jgi:hypothetical protein
LSKERLEYEEIEPVRLEETDLMGEVELRTSQLEELSAPFKEKEADDPLLELERIDAVE